MLLRLSLIFSLLFLLIIPAFSQDEVGSDDGPVQVTPDTQENVVSIPVDEETGMVNWDDYLSLPSGGGANFGFNTQLFPPDPAALADTPSILLDGAWSPPVPFAYGYEPPTAGQFYAQGWWYLEDASGNLARRDMTITSGENSWFSSTWYVGGGWLFDIEEGWPEGYFQEGYYLPDDWSGPGIDFFIRSVWFRGVLGGERMEALLTQCNAQRIGRDRMNAGHDRVVIYQIPASENDRQNGRGSLLVWIFQTDFRIISTRLHATYGTEVTEFLNVSIEVDNDPAAFYSNYLTRALYWSIDQYLLTHDTFYFNNPTGASFTAAPPATTETTDTETTESTDEGTVENTGDSGESETPADTGEEGTVQ